MAPLLLLALLMAACSGAPARNGQRPLDAAAHSAARLFDQFLCPRAIATDLGQMRASARQLGDGELDLGTARSTGAAMVAVETKRPRGATSSTVAALVREEHRLGDLRHSQAWGMLDPQPDLVDLSRDMRALPQMLRLDRRMMAEPEDLQHRSNPHDDRPAASWSARFFRRILP